jgi:hypothetical protein
MAVFTAFALIVAASAGGISQKPAFVPTKAVAAAHASARIVSGARIHLGAAAQPDGFTMQTRRITAEDGSRRSAHLVEFE